MSSKTTCNAARSHLLMSVTRYSTKPTGCSTSVSATTLNEILKRCPTERQTLLMSATVPDAIQAAAVNRYMRDQVHLHMTPEKPVRIKSDPPELFHRRSRPQV